jgi:predicted nucleic acid-binding Zn ribbon protein
LTDGEKTKKQYIFPHRHCVYCGRMIEVKGRSYCLKCKPEFEKDQGKKKKSKRYRQFLIAYAVIVVIVFVVLIFIYSR